MTVTEVIDALRDLCPGAVLDAAGPPVPIAPDLAASDTGSILGPLPHTALRDGLARTIEFQDARHSMGHTA